MVIILVVCMFGCGKKEAGMPEKEVASAEKKQVEIKLPEEKHDFIKNEIGRASCRERV